MVRSLWPVGHEINLAWSQHFREKLNIKTEETVSESSFCRQAKNCLLLSGPWEEEAAEGQRRDTCAGNGPEPGESSGDARLWLADNDRETQNYDFEK